MNHGPSKTIGILGGASSESTHQYYRRLDRAVNEHFGGHTDADLLIRSLDFGAIKARQDEGDWEGVAEILVPAARSLEAGGADVVLLASNTLHRVAPAVEAALSVPFVHIADPTAAAIEAAGVERVGLLGTRHVTGGEFYADRLAASGIETVVPEQSGREELDGLIFGELTRGEVTASGREAVRSIAADLVEAGAGGIVLGCTELALVVEGERIAGVPAFDTTARHVERAVELATES